MTVAAYHVVNNPVIYKKLRAELKTAFPSPDSRLNFTELEKLPYLVSHLLLTVTYLGLLSLLRLEL
jgi:hypothetical protein